MLHLFALRGLVSNVHLSPVADVGRTDLWVVMTLSLGPDWQRDLWASPYRLRFELGQGGSYVSMFTSSYDRARTLARAALPADELVGIIAAYAEPGRELGAKSRGGKRGTAFELLDERGVPTDLAVRHGRAFGALKTRGR
jgi:hypothetical protein